MKTLIGSQALKLYIPHINPNDTDYFSNEKVEGAESFYHPDLEKWHWSDVATLDELYTIKVSHIFWRVPIRATEEYRTKKYNRHLMHIIEMQRAGAKFIPELYEILYPIWEETHGKKKANLNATPEEFFTSTVQRKYDHDSVHASIAFYEEPLFKAILRDGSDVAVDKDKFYALSHEDKIKLVQEEIFATALERKVITQNGQGWKQAYGWALVKLITSFSKGWFPLWVVLHFDELKSAPFNYYHKMQKNAHRLIPLEDGHSLAS